MKEYNIKAIVEDGRLNLLFECDKDKNTQCNKKYCGTRNHTTDVRYMKAKARQGSRNITDKELVVNLENEIEYYRHKIDLLEKVREEDRRYINKQDEIIKEYQETFTKIIINKEDIFKTKTFNQVRKLLRLKEIKFEYDLNKNIINKQDAKILKSEKENKLDNNMKETTAIDIYANGKLVETIIKYK